MKLVNVVLATYRPNMTYLDKLLVSLNNQTYQNIEITIRDDSADQITYDKISDLIKEKIINFNYTIHKNSQNIGSNKTFELLTKESKGDYIAYCDQDDIWEKEKIYILVKTTEEENAALCYSDLSIINENDLLIANSFKDIRKRLRHVYGENLFQYFLTRNSVTGCTMLIKSDIAKNAIPFCHGHYIHDHWLTLWASMFGKIAYVNKPLTKYRIHDNNQIGASWLLGINNKDDYFNNKLLKEKSKYEYLLNNYKFDDSKREQIQKIGELTKRRIDFFIKKDIKNTIFMIKNIKNDWQLFTFEILINMIPRNFSKKIFEKLKN